MKDINEAKKALKITGTIYRRGYNWVTFARNHLENQLINAQWSNYKKDHPTLYDAPLLHTDTSTFENCVDCEFVVNGDDIIMTLIIYQGDSYNGYRLPGETRCFFQFAITEMYEVIEQAINNELRHVAIQKIEQEDHIKMNKRIAAKVTQMLSKVK